MINILVIWDLKNLHYCAFDFINGFVLTVMVYLSEVILYMECIGPSQAVSK